MTPFESNIQTIYGEKGKEWLKRLPTLVEEKASRLGLRDLQVVSNLSYNYIVSGFQGLSPLILKIGFEEESLKKEAAALKCFRNHGSVRLLLEEEGLLLLEHAVPGLSLKSYFPSRELDSIEIACQVMHWLHQAPIPEKHSFPHIKDWLSALDKDVAIPFPYLQKARSLRDHLLATKGADMLLHGDLHHDNILQNGKKWVVIDPKGVIGEQAFEAAAFIRNPIPEFLNPLLSPLPQERLKSRIALFSERLEVSEKRVADWCFVQAVLAWTWALEDLLDAEYFEKITRFLERDQG